MGNEEMAKGYEADIGKVQEEIDRMHARSTMYRCEYATPKGLRSITFALAFDEIADYQDGRLTVRNVRKTGTPVVRAYDHVFCFEPAQEAP